MIVVIVPDGGRSYLSKIFSDSWMRQYGFLERKSRVVVGDVLRHKASNLIELLDNAPNEYYARCLVAIRARINLSTSRDTGWTAPAALLRVWSGTRCSSASRSR